MFVIVNKFILANRYDGLVIWPFLVVREKKLKQNKVFMNHERIHERQQLELLFVFFFVWYISEYICRLLFTGSHQKAYCAVSFEREAYAQENNVNYLKTRGWWAFLKYL